MALLWLAQLTGERQMLTKARMQAKRRPIVGELTEEVIRVIGERVRG
jgi:hypothetical protein